MKTDLWSTERPSKLSRGARREIVVSNQPAMHKPPPGAPPRAAGSNRRVLANKPPTQVIVKASLSVDIDLTTRCMLQVADAVSAELAEACEENVHRMDGAVQVMLILLACW